MSDLFKLSNLTTVDVDSPSSAGSDLDTGDLRRKYNFGSQVSELSIAQDPFFRFVSMVSKNPTDDPSFKFTERRPSYHKRFAYVTNHGASAPAALAGTDATVGAGAVDAGDVYYFCMCADYESQGNIGTTFGNTSNDILVGASGTQPQFFLQNQLIKIPYGDSGATFSGGVIDALDGYLVAKIDSVDTVSVSNATILKTTIVKGTAAAIELASYYAAGDAIDAQDISSLRIHDQLEPKRSYVVGTAHAEGSGYPETWKDQPFSTGYGQTQIWKTSMAMTNTARATSLKYDSSEWARVWKEKLIEHKWDIEQSLLFGSQYSNDGINYTQGAVDFITSYGNQFSWNTSKSQDDFLNDMSSYLDPRYNNGNATVFFCSTDVYNWLHKLGGYAMQNVQISPNYQADLSVSGKKNVLGLGVSTINTVYGDINLVRNIHLDGSHVKILAANMKYAKYRPLVGNGVDRDTSIYVGVQTLENSGVDRRVDLILTEAGMEFSMPEAHAVWTKTS